MFSNLKGKSLAEKQIKKMKKKKGWKQIKKTRKNLYTLAILYRLRP